MWSHKVGQGSKTRIPRFCLDRLWGRLFVARLASSNNVRSLVACRVFLGFVFPFFLLSSAALAEEANRIQSHTDFSEADAVLSILDKRDAGQMVEPIGLESAVRYRALPPVNGSRFSSLKGKTEQLC